MKFPKVIIQNFLAIGEAGFTLDGLGLTHLSGENNDETSADSNGSGKSSIADAISWCLWGTTARGLSGDDVVNTAAGKNCCVSIDIDDEGDLYRVTRHRKNGKHKNALELHQFDPNTNEWVDRTKGTTTLTQKAIERILGCSEEVFNAAVYLGQEQMPDLPNMTDKQLKVLVEQAAGIDVLTNACDIARDDLREASQKRAEAQIELDRAVERHADSNASMVRLSDEKTLWETKHKQTIDKLKHETTQALAAYKKAEAEFDAAGEAEVLKGIKECQDKIAAVTEERDREKVLSDDHLQANNALQRAVSAVAIAQRGAEDAARAYKDAELELAKAEQGVGTPCPSCTRPLTGDHLKASIDRAKQKMADKKQFVQERAQALVDTKQKHGIAQKMADNSKQALDDFRATMTDVSIEGQRLQSLQRELQVLRAHRAEIDRLKNVAQTAGEKLKQDAMLENPYVTLIEEEEKRLIERADIVEQWRQKRDALIEAEKYAEAVAAVFAPDGVRAHRLDEATPYLNDRTAHYLGSLADGAIDAYWTTISENKARNKLLEKFSITVEKQGSAPNFKALSGGEKRKVRLACALALQDLVATRAAKSIDMWLADEIDDALDVAGLERLMSVLEEKARERGTVLVISHNDIAAYARRQMTVTKNNGKAKVTMN